MIQNILTHIFGTKFERDLKVFNPLVEKINSLEPQFKALTDQELKSKTAGFKEQLDQGASLDDLLPESFATCREASRRVLGMRHFDVQLIGGMVLHQGNIAEMKTGEGKTLVATLPVYLNALSGKGVHVVTVNDYLAKRDTEWMGQIYNWLNLSVGAIVHDLSDKSRRLAYGSDITYGTNNEFGFDYLRDNMKFELGHYVQRELNFAIVDECDSILIDEARTPLIISGPAEESTDKYYQINRIIPNLKKEVHFTMEEKSKSASLTEEGNSKVESLLNIKNLYDITHINLLHHIYQSLKAHYLYKKDVDYMVKDNQIIIVDEFTGRLMPGRRWSDGLHQAIEAKEGVHVKKENQTLASVTFQNYFRMYKKLAGMTGTAETEAQEFAKIYNLNVVVVPTNKPIRRMDKNDIIYKTKRAKFRAIIDEIKEIHKKNQPILVGTVSIENSEELSALLTKEQVRHNVLNAKHHEREAEIIAQAGRLKAVTLATNMAGRGTDIVLGGNPELLSKSELNRDATEEHKEQSLKKFKTLCEKEKDEVIKAGGLYILGTERHDSRRIDNQLRGRSGRQGDPGMSCFYLSLEDSLMRKFGADHMKKMMNFLNIPEDEAITAKLVSNSIAKVQKRVEGYHFDIRKQLLEYDNVLNQQRTVFYQMRKNLLTKEKQEEQALNFLSDVTSYLLDLHVGVKTKKEDWGLTLLTLTLQKQLGVHVELKGDIQDAKQVDDIVSAAVKSAYDKKKEELKEHFLPVLKLVVLQTLDQRWQEHLENIDRVREGIYLRAHGQKDPLVEYKKEAFSLFEHFILQIASESIEKLFKIQIAEESQNQDYEMEDEPGERNLSFSKPEFQQARQALGTGPQQRPQDGNRAERRRLKNKEKRRAFKI